MKKYIIDFFVGLGIGLVTIFGPALSNNLGKIWESIFQPLLKKFPIFSENFFAVGILYLFVSLPFFALYISLPFFKAHHDKVKKISLLYFLSGVAVSYLLFMVVVFIAFSHGGFGL